MFFWLLAKLAELCPTGALSTRRARLVQSAQEITNELGAPEGHFLHRRPREERPGLDGVERTPRIRRTATKKR